MSELNPPVLVEDGGRGPQDKECWQPLEAENVPQMTANKEIGTSVWQLQETEFCQHEWAKKWILPRASRKECSLQTLDVDPVSFAP